MTMLRDFLASLGALFPTLSASSSPGQVMASVSSTPQGTLLLVGLRSFMVTHRDYNNAENVPTGVLPPSVDQANRWTALRKPIAFLDLMHIN
jgi:hypothetical protein